MIGSYYNYIWNTLKHFYNYHSNILLFINLIIVIGTMAYISWYHGFKKEAPFTSTDDMDYLMIPFFESLFIWSLPILSALLSMILPLLLITFIPFGIGRGIRIYVDWINKPQPGPFEGQKLEAKDFEVHNDWKN